MQFLMRCVDKPGHAQVRADKRPQHLEHLKAHLDQIVVAGPTLSDDGEATTGSLLLVDFPDRASAEAFADADPYAAAGLFEQVEIRRWKKVLP